LSEQPQYRNFNL